MRKRRKAMKKLVSGITGKHVALVAAVCVVLVSATYASTGNLSTLAVLGKGQLAVAGEADMQCTPDKDYTCPFGTPKEKCPKKQKPGGLGMPCIDVTNGKPTPGKCTAEMKCKADPPGGGGQGGGKGEEKKEEPKGGGGGEPPKLPEIPKGEEKPPAQSSQGDAKQAEKCPEGIYNSTGTAPKIDPETGLPCTTANSGDVWYSTAAATTSTTTVIIATSTKSSTVQRTWSAIVRTVSNGVQSVGNFISGNASSNANVPSPVKANPNTTQVYVLDPSTGLLRPVQSSTVYNAQIYQGGTGSTIGTTTIESGRGNVANPPNTSGQPQFISPLEQLKNVLISLSNLLTEWIH